MTDSNLGVQKIDILVDKLINVQPIYFHQEEIKNEIQDISFKNEEIEKQIMASIIFEE